jgi:integration host factor subunit alpha
MKLALDSIDLTSLTKANLNKLLLDQLGGTQREAADLVDAFFEIITERLVAGEEVKLTDFAGFQVRTKAARPGRNPRTGEQVKIAKRRVVTFQSGPKLKARLKSSILHQTRPLALQSSARRLRRLRLRTRQ